MSTKPGDEVIFRNPLTTRSRRALRELEAPVGEVQGHLVHGLGFCLVVLLLLRGNTMGSLLTASGYTGRRSRNSMGWGGVNARE